MLLTIQILAFQKAMTYKKNSVTSKYIITSQKQINPTQNFDSGTDCFAFDYIVIDHGLRGRTILSHSSRSAPIFTDSK
jgi:hypothetical protein